MMETSDNVTKTTLLQRLIITSLNETLQRCRFRNIFRRFHRNYKAMLEKHCNDVIIPTGMQLPILLIVGAALVFSIKILRWMFLEF